MKDEFPEITGRTVNNPKILLFYFMLLFFGIFIIEAFFKQQILFCDIYDFL
jgi:hypothetical protein